MKKLRMFLLALVMISTFPALGLSPQQYCEALKAKGGNFELLNVTSTPLLVPNPVSGGNMVVFITEEKSCVNGDFVVWRINGVNNTYSCVDGRGHRENNMTIIVNSGSGGGFTGSGGPCVNSNL